MCYFLLGFDINLVASIIAILQRVFLITENRSFASTFFYFRNRRRLLKLYHLFCMGVAYASVLHSSSIVVVFATYLMILLTTTSSMEVFLELCSSLRTRACRLFDCFAAFSLQPLICPIESLSKLAWFHDL